MHNIQQIAERSSTRFMVELDDVQMFAPDLVKDIVQNTKRYVSMFGAAIDELLPPIPRAIGAMGDTVDDVLRATRIANLDRNPEVAGSGEPLSAEALKKFLPPQLLRRYEVRFSPLSSTKPVALRGISATEIGKLVSAQCIVLRASDVKPLIEVAAYSWYV